MSFVRTAFGKDAFGVTAVTLLGVAVSGGYMARTLYSHNDVTLTDKTSALKTLDKNTPVFVDKNNARAAYDRFVKETH